MTHKFTFKAKATHEEGKTEIKISTMITVTQESNKVDYRRLLRHLYSKRSGYEGGFRKCQRRLN